MTGPGLRYIGKEEEELILEVIRSRELSRYRFDTDEISNPSKIYTFEKEACEYLNCKYSLALNSCTSALLSGLIALGIKPGDEVIVPGYTFVASIASIVHAGAIPVLAEIDDSLTIDPESVKKKITSRTKAVMCVHMLGAPCNMDALTEITEQHGLSLIEDVAQACGGQYHGQKLGVIGDCGAFSLNVFKTITSGDGGILTTNRDDVYNTAFAFHDHGFSPHRLRVQDGGQEIFGLNLRLHELSGAVALAQLRKLSALMYQLKKQKQTFLKVMGEVPAARLRRLNDTGGDCCTLIVYIFDSKNKASKVANALGTIPLIASQKHYYGEMPQLQAVGNANEGRYCIQGKKGNYSKGTLPRTDDFLSRSIALSVGVRDSYLGSSFGIDVDSSEDDIAKTAGDFKRLTTGILY